MVDTIALADAKATLSAVVKRVGETGAEYIVTVRGKPSAMIVPVPKESPKELRAAAMLAGKRPAVSREAEKASYAQMLEAKYGNPS